MKLSYNVTEPDEITKKLAEEIVKKIVASGVTYLMADTALTTAQRLLEQETRPVSLRTPHVDDLEWISAED